jgi:hypothetical protein
MARTRKPPLIAALRNVRFPGDSGLPSAVAEGRRSAKTRHSPTSQILIVSTFDYGEYRYLPAKENDLDQGVQRGFETAGKKVATMPVSVKPYAESPKLSGS